MADGKPDLEPHLTDAELFAIAVPATGDPEALPRHLSRCRECSRALGEWQSAVQMLGEEDGGELDRRTSEEWRRKEEATMASIRRAAAGRRAGHPWRWAVGIAASLLLVVLLLPSRRGPAAAAVPTPAPAAVEAELSAADRADDELLREASYLAAGGDDESDGGLEGRL